MLQSFEPGATFAGAYEIIKPLSAGGMGEVFVVRHRELGELRAMKLMHPQVGRDERLRQKFSQEARIGTRIKSEHVVRVLDVGVDQASMRPWFAMELLEGADLRSFIDKHGPHPPETIRKILGQLAHALSAAHRAGIVHRDLKPENIFVAASARADEAFTVKVLDFGIAKIVAESNTDMSVPIGSPLWMAPEQAEAGATIGPHTDVWPIGLIGFYLLTGKIFWMAAHVPNATPVQVLQEVMFNPIPLASERAAALGHRFGLPDGFDAWFAKCLSRHGAERFHDASAAFDALSAILGARVSVATIAMAMPVGVSAAPAATPARLEQSAPQPLRMNTTGVVSSQSIPQPPKKASSAPLWIAVAVVVAGLGVGAFVMKDKLFGGAKSSTTAEPVAATKPVEGVKEAATASPIVAASQETRPASPSPSAPGSAAEPAAQPPPTNNPDDAKPGPTPNPPSPTPPTPPTGPVVKPPPTAPTSPTPKPPCPPTRYDEKLDKVVPNNCPK